VRGAFQRLGTLPLHFKAGEAPLAAPTALSAVCGIEWDPQAILAAVGSVDGCVRLYDHDEMFAKQTLVRNAATVGSSVVLMGAPAVSLVCFTNVHESKGVGNACFVAVCRAAATQVTIASPIVLD